MAPLKPEEYSFDMLPPHIKEEIMVRMDPRDIPALRKLVEQLRYNVDGRRVFARFIRERANIQHVPDSVWHTMGRVYLCARLRAAKSVLEAVDILQTVENYGIRWRARTASYVGTVDDFGDTTNVYAVIHAEPLNPQRSVKSRILLSVSSEENAAPTGVVADYTGETVRASSFESLVDEQFSDSRLREWHTEAQDLRGENPVCVTKTVPFA